MAVTGTEAQIYDALMWFVGQVVTDPAMKRSEPNVAFTTVLKTPYLSITYLPNTAALFGNEFDSDVDYQGLFQVSVFWPAGAGLVKASQVAAQIAAAFRPGTRIDRNGLQVRIDQQPSVAAALQESDWVQIPVTVRWRAFVPAVA